MTPRPSPKHTFRNVVLGVGFAVILAGSLVDLADFVEKHRTNTDDSSQTFIQEFAGSVASSVTDQFPTSEPGAGEAFPDWPPGSPANTYTVAKGDMLYEIAIQHDTTAQVLMELNQLADPHRIEIGQVLLLPEPDLSPAR